MTESRQAARPAAISELRVLVLVGTDVHPFDRLVGWVENYTPSVPFDWTIQFGSSRASKLPGSAAFLDRAELAAALASAHVVICHGGPATITEARSAGLLPLVVPRDPKLGEHIDDHQQRFARRLGRSGLVEICETEESLRVALERAEADPATFRIDNADAAAVVVATALNIGRIADELVAGARPARVPRQSARGATPPEARATRRTATAPARVLYIGGWGRSGSTLAERLIGEAPEMVGAGEVTHLWQRGLIDNELCACGTPFHDCPFWSAVGDRAFGGWKTIDADAVIALKHRVDRNRFVPRLALPTALTRRRRDLIEYTDLHRTLYAAIAQVAGASVVIDSSKHPSLAFALRHNRAIDMRVLHLVRDGRGVAYSWAKEVRRPEATGTGAGALMPRYSPTKSGVLWTMHNWMFHVLHLVHRRVRLMRYEDMVADPYAKLAEVRAFLDLPPAEPAYLQIIDGSPVAQVGPSHSIAGNPMRFTNGRLTLRTDSAWRAAAPKRGRRKIALLTWPGRLRYGYLDRPGRGRGKHTKGHQS